MATKKKVKSFDLFVDFLVKLNNVFNDVYVIDRKYCIAGKITDEVALGDILCTVEEKYQNAMSELKIPDAIYIENIRELKAGLKLLPDDIEVINEIIKDLDISNSELENICLMIEADASIEDICNELKISCDNIEEVKKKIISSTRAYQLHELITVVKDENTINECKDKILKISNEFCKELIWDNMGLNAELIKAVYTEKKIFNLVIPKDGSYITIAKQLFPIVTEKTISSAFMNIRKDENYQDLYIIMIDFNFTHFRFQAIYHSVPTKFI